MVGVLATACPLPRGKPPSQWDQSHDILSDIREASRKILADTGLRPNICVVGRAHLDYAREELGIDLLDPEVVAELKKDLNIDVRGLTIV